MSIIQAIRGLEGEALGEAITKLNPMQQKIALGMNTVQERLGGARVPTAQGANPVGKVATNEGATAGQTTGSVLTNQQRKEKQKEVLDRLKEEGYPTDPEVRKRLFSSKGGLIGTREVDEKIIDDYANYSPEEMADLYKLNFDERVSESASKYGMERNDAFQIAAPVAGQKARQNLANTLLNRADDLQTAKAGRDMGFDEEALKDKELLDMIKQDSRFLPKGEAKTDDIIRQDILHEVEFAEEQMRRLDIEEARSKYKAMNERDAYDKEVDMELANEEIAFQKQSDINAANQEMERRRLMDEAEAEFTRQQEVAKIESSFVGRYAPDDASANVEMGGPIFGSIEAGGLMGFAQAMGMGAAVGGAASLATGGEFSEGAVMGGIAGGAIRGINSAIRANASGLENMLYKNVFKNAPIPERQAERVAAMRNMKESELGFVQQQARSMLLSENASLTTQSRGAIMAGAGLTGMMFTSPRKDKRRGFNKHRGNRI